VAIEALNRGHNVIGTYYSTDNLSINDSIRSRRIDISDSKHVAALIKSFDPDCVINGAAITDVDRCESDPETAHAVNSRGPETIAQACATIDSQFIHFSTDYVFDGTRDSPYPEAAKRNPVQEYGQTKLASEQNVLRAHPSPLILRVSFVHGRNRATEELEGFPRWVLDQFNTEGKIPLFDDQWFSPTRAGQVAETALELCRTGEEGIFHTTSRTCTTPYAFGDSIRETVGASATAINRASRSDVDLPAQRPRYTCLDIQRIESALGREQPTLTDDLKSLEPVINSHYIR
jgi:dTDP-4-dehydrorhamnose reductase